DEIVAPEVTRVEPRPAEHRDRALDVARGGDLPDGPAEIGDRRGSAMVEVERVYPGGLEPEHGPAGHRRARVLAAVEPEAAVAVLRLAKPGDRRAGAAAGCARALPGKQRRSRDQECREQARGAHRGTTRPAGRDGGPPSPGEL